MGLYVKKLWTVNPKAYKHLLLNDAINLYRYYIQAWTESYIAGHTTDDQKSFNEWLETEI